MMSVLPGTDATVSYGLRPLGRIRGLAVFAARYATFPIAVAVAVFFIVVGTDSTLSETWRALILAVDILSVVVAFFGLAALTFALAGRVAHGRTLRGVAFYLNERELLVGLSTRTVTRFRPLSQLRMVEVRYSSDASHYNPDDESVSAWLRLSFESSKARRTVRYHVTPYHLAHSPRDSVLPGLADHLRGLLDAHYVIVRG